MRANEKAKPFKPSVRKDYTTANPLKKGRAAPNQCRRFIQSGCFLEGRHIVDIPRSACLKDVRSRSPRSRTAYCERMMREKCACTVVQSGPWMVPKPNTAWSLGSASRLAKLSELARKAQRAGSQAQRAAALSTGNLDDATGSIDDVLRSCSNQRPKKIWPIQSAKPETTGIDKLSSTSTGSNSAAPPATPPMTDKTKSWAPETPLASK